MRPLTTFAVLALSAFAAQPATAQPAPTPPASAPAAAPARGAEAAPPPAPERKDDPPPPAAPAAPPAAPPPAPPPPPPGPRARDFDEHEDHPGMRGTFRGSRYDDDDFDRRDSDDVAPEPDDEAKLHEEFLKYRDRRRRPARGPEARVLFGGEVEHGGYGALVLKPGWINGGMGLFVGARGAWIINHSFAIGGGGYGLSTRRVYRGTGGEPDLDIETGYGGITFEYMLRPEKVFHLRADVLIGAGGACLRRANYEYAEDFHDVCRDSTGFFVLEPAVGGELNVAQFMRFAVDVSYRLVAAQDWIGPSDSRLGGATAGFHFRFGKF